MRGADLLVRTLAEAGVTRIFSLSGNQIMSVYDACLDAGIALVHTRHEAAAVFMAEAWAQLTGGLGVALVTAAPGAANAVGPLFSARRSETPVLLLTGDSPRGQDGMGAFQELDQAAMTAPLAKLSFRARSAAALGEDAARAIRAALSGRPGPVHLALPADALEGDAADAAIPPRAALAPAAAGAGPEAATALRDALADAARPLILAGPVLSATRGGDLLARLSAALDAPALALESPRGLRDPALGGFAGALAEADLVVSLGKPVDFMTGFGAGAARWIVADPEAAERDRAHRALGARLALTLEAEPRALARSLAVGAHAGGAGRRDWRESVAERIAARAPAPPAPPGRIGSADLAAAVARRVAAAPGAVFVSDGGEIGQWAQAGVACAAARVINGPAGAIGAALPQAIAAAMARPGTPVWAVSGDGAAGFHLAEFETAVREGAAFVLVIGADGRWNAEHQIQLRAYGADRLVGCGLGPARYDRAAAALGGHGEYAASPDDLEAALDRAAASGGPACVHVEIEGAAAPVAPTSP